METLQITETVGAEARIKGGEYADLEIHGPAVFQLADSNNVLEECIFDVELDKSLVGIERPIRGTIEISGTKFRRCIFRNIGFVGAETLVERLKVGAKFRP
jgi:hypothetical protein